MSADVPEGCTPADAQVLRKANHDLAQENHELRELIREAAGLFRQYEAHHWAKGTPESDAKARVNEQIAARLEDKLR